MPSCPAPASGPGRHRRAQAVRAAGRPYGGGAHAGGTGAPCRDWRPRWWCWRPTTRPSRPSCRASRRRAPGWRAAAAPRAPRRWRSGLAWPCCANAARATTTGCWCTTPRAACCGPHGSTGSSTPAWTTRSGGLLALPLADTLKAARGDRVSGHARPQRQVAGADAADVPPGPAAACAGRRPAGARHRRVQRRRGAGPGAAAGAGRDRELQTHLAGRLRAAPARLLETR